MSTYDQFFHGRSPDGEPLTLAVKGGIIEAVSSSLSGSAETETDFGDATILPGWIDAHVHFNEPGRSDWEGLTTGSRALAAGGGTAFFDMPLNSSPPVITAEALHKKRALAEEKSCVDFALWGGLTPDSVSEIIPMAEAGAIGFKAFMCPSGLDEFPHSDPATLREGMKIAAALGLPVAVHAEIDPKTKRKNNEDDMAAWLASRPISWELEAIQIALDLAIETGCALHVVHVSCAEGIDLIKSSSADVTAETCPHYLLLDTNDAIRIGAAAKCAPPLRPDPSALWSRIEDIDTIGSDHSPAPPEMKQGEDIFKIWGGIAGIQHGLPLLLDHDTDITEKISANVARRFNLQNKGGLRAGHEADFCVVTESPHTITKKTLLTRHAISPYLERIASHQITATYQRGTRVTSTSRGKFLTPTQAP